MSLKSAMQRRVKAAPDPTPLAIVEPPVAEAVIEAPTVETSASVSPAPEPIILDDLGRLKAFRARYRHRFKTGGFADPVIEVKRRVRAELVAGGVSPEWSSFAARFGFTDEVSIAMLRVLVSPAQCTAPWFEEGRIAVHRAGLDLSTLSYEVIREAIADWRVERKPVEPPAETETETETR